MSQQSAEEPETDDSVALARAVYGKFNSYVLDDVFSALDATTEAHVFASLFGSTGLLRGKTVILATNQVYRLAQADLITCLEAGRIVEQGDYSTLLAQGGTLSKLIKEYTTGSKAQEQEKALAPAQEAEGANDDAKSDLSGGRETSAQGSVRWSTYGLYLKSMGWGHASICELASRNLSIADTLLRVLNDCCDGNHTNLYQHLPSSLDDCSETRVTT